MPSSAFDTFFACTILVAAVLIATAFLGTTLQARVVDTQDLNKDSYLKAVADRIVTGCGTPADWGTDSAAPSDFGLAAVSASGVYALDPDKISRLNSQNGAALSIVDLVNSSKLTDIALGIQVSQVLSIDLLQVSNQTASGTTTFNFQVTTSIDSRLTQTELQGYIIAESYFDEFNASTGSTGTSEFSVQVPEGKVDNAGLIMFARAPFDDRITSFTVYVFTQGDSETTPRSTRLALSPLDGTLSFNSSAGIVTRVYALTYSYYKTVNSTQDGQCQIPELVDVSPTVLVACGYSGGYLQEWAAYPQVPLTAGSSFANSERNIFSYTVTINGVLYRLQISLGAPNL